MNLSQYFATSYVQARQKFMACCTSEATFTQSWQHPLRGIEGEKLYLDLAWFGDPAANKIMILLSGTHGVEGFCGSGIQVATIKTHLHHQASQDVAILMIHGLNPWGMSFFRRVNEDGVDLNRNFLDFQQPLPINPLYNDLADVIIPLEWTTEVRVQTLQQIFEYLAKSDAQTSNIAKGQYSHWYAPFYGGEVPTWSNRTFYKIVNKYLQDKEAVGLLDYHTGLGRYGTGQLMTIKNNTAIKQNLASKIWGDKAIATGSADSVAPYEPQGTLIAALEGALKPSICIAAAYEFGTIAETEVFDALRADHWLHLHGDLNSQQAQIIRNDMLNAFYGNLTDWQESVCDLAFDIQLELLAGLRSITFE